MRAEQVPRRPWAKGGRMRSSILLAVLLLVAGMVEIAPAKAKKQAELSKLFCQARYVSVLTYEGDTTPDVAQAYPGDYDAAIGVAQRLQRWGRYTVVYAPQPADLVFVVWKERKGGNRLPGQPAQVPPISCPPVQDPGTGQMPGGPGQPQGRNPGGIDGPDGVDVSRGGPGIGGVLPVNDQLAVYLPEADESLSTALWKHSQKDGLKEPDMPLFSKLADAVDDACSDSGGSSK